MKTLLLAGCALLLTSTSACSTLSGLPGASTSGASDFASAVTTLNNQLAQNCGGTVTLNWSPPLPPSGGLAFTCTKPQPVMVPLNQVGSLIQAPAAAPVPVVAAPVAPAK